MVQEISSTESDFEAEIHKAIRLVFPWLPYGSIQHQTTFSIKFGQKKIPIDNGSGWDNAYARADILLKRDEQHLAILELKRPGVPINSDDEKQGLSYARVLNPTAPLVVVTNGTDCRLLQTHTGEKWLPENPSEQAFADLVRAAGFAARKDLKLAISTLMGSNSQIWVQAIKQTSAQYIEDLSGKWRESRLPFVSEFLIPRKATQTVLQKLREDARLLLVEGPPLIGKSNVLRELFVETQNSNDLVTLIVDADAGKGLLKQLAGCLSQALSWPVSESEVRSWLLNLSNADGPALVLAVDGVGLGLDELINDINDLSSSAFGSSLQIVVAVDDTVADRLALNSTGRSWSAIGRRGNRVTVGPLKDDEFIKATCVLWKHRAEIMNGGEFSPELRLPWVLRAVMSEITTRSGYADKKLAALIPPFLGINLIAHARKHLGDDELRRQLRAVAEAVIEDAQDRSRPISLMLQSVVTFALRRDTLERHLEHVEIEKLSKLGYLRPHRHESRTDILVVRVPELVASEVADVLTVELLPRCHSDAAKASEWLSETASNIPFGDVIATQALFDAVTQNESLPFSLIMHLLRSSPQQHSMKPGTKVAMLGPGKSTINLTFQNEGAVKVEAPGHRHMLTLESNDGDQIAYSGLDSWLILSHLAGLRLAMEDEKGRLTLVSPKILLTVGACPIVLRRPYAESIPCMMPPTHELPNHESIVCHEVGIVEPITWSIFKFLCMEDEKAEEWIDESVRQESFPLLMRIAIALKELSKSAQEERAKFAQRMLDEAVSPALLKLGPLH